MYTIRIKCNKTIDNSHNYDYNDFGVSYIMSNKKINIILSIVTLFFGGTIYIIYRENSYISNFIENIIDLTILRNMFKPFGCDFIKYYLIDYLWALSSSLNSLFTAKKGTLRICVFVFSLGSTWEILQFLNIISGTGDIADIFMYLTAVITTVIIKFSTNKGEQK